MSSNGNFIDPFEETIIRHPQLSLRAHIIPLGLNVTRLIFDDPVESFEHDVIIGPESPQDHWRFGRKFLGPVVGRYANRLPVGKHKFDHDQQTIDIEEYSAFSKSGVSLHGGPEEENRQLGQIPRNGFLVPQVGPFDRLVWQPLSSDQSQLFGPESASTAKGSSAIFGLLSKGVAPGGQQKGYPGDIRIEVRLAIVPGKEGNESISTSTTTPANLGKSAGTFHMEYRAKLVDGECTATPINLTHHWAFNVSTSDAKARSQDKGTIENHTFRLIPPPMFDEQRKPQLYAIGTCEKWIPTGTLLETENTPHDWSNEGKEGLGKTIIHKGGHEGYDQFYTWGAPEKKIVEKLNQSEYEKALHAQPRMILHAPSSQVTLTVRTNQTGVQVYTANSQPPHPAVAEESGGAKKKLHSNPGEEGLGNHQRSGIALEFSHPHGTFLHEKHQQFAQDDTVLRKGEQYRNWVELEVFKRV
ncbi:galactose mutarotase-like protein [Meira miltonrushii]|uniref:Galactose mutarotase-like protein n=1 Tax=Meira miltonrushii TaxID=1280837 RepID=A0A316VLC5_9BASI|nr:galactose mutarotase-like protein [Meira miltonrushii]PWN38260.1 galactose mutarotase-like protein [Meira miltonrushii]